MWRLLFLLWLTGPLAAHTVEHTVEQKPATIIGVLFADGEEASFSEYELFGPGDKTPYQIGRTDVHGRIALLPDRAGSWTARVKADSQHGLHGFNITLQVNDSLVAHSLSQPVVATHTRLLIGMGILLGLFGGLSLLRGRKKA
jgi:nickel transport protein